MKIKRIKLFSHDGEEEATLDELYSIYENYKKPQDKAEKLKAGIVPGIGLGSVGGLVGYKTNKRAGLGALAGAGLGFMTGYKIKDSKIKKGYKENKEELKNILRGFKTSEEKRRFLASLEQQLSSINEN